MAEVVAKKGKNRKALKTISTNDVNISAGKLSSSFAKSNNGISLILSPGKANKVVSNASAAAAARERSLAEELKDVQRRLEQFRVEKEKTEELLKQRDELIKSKEEELEIRAKEHEKLQKELRKLQKMKEFKPTMNLPLVKSLREKEQEKNEKEKHKKKNKDCPEKKKPSSAYILWSKDQWNEVKAEKPDADFKDISNIVAAKWKNLSAEDKKPYEERYQQEKEAYLLVVGKEKRENEAMKLLEEEQMQKTAMELLEQYLQFKQEAAANEEGKKAKKEKDPLKPKKPLSAFFLFTNDRRAALLAEKKNVLEISKIASEEWKSMTEEEKATYEEIARKQKEEYNIQMELYKQKKIEEAATLEKEEMEQKKVLKQEALQLLKKKEKTENIIKKTKETKKQQKEKKNSDPNKPKKPASSFFLFSKETRKELLQERPDIGNSTLNAMISVKWKELSDEERKIWNVKATEGMSAYRKEMEEYNRSIAAVKLVTSDPNSSLVQ